LDTTSKRNDENKIEMTITFSADEVKKKIDSVYKVAGKARIPGFRPGKVPRAVLDKYFGGKAYFLVQATEELIEGNLSTLIDQAGHVPLDKPDLSTVGILEEGKDYVITTSFTVRPLLELSSYDPVQIELPDENPTPEEIEDQIGLMLQYYSYHREVTDRPVQEKDLVEIDLSMDTDDGQGQPLVEENIPYELGSGLMSADFDEHLIGMKIGETRQFDFKLLPVNKTETEDVKLSHAVVTLNAIKEITRPELTDEWVQETLEYDSVQDFRDRIIETLKVRKRNALKDLKERLVLAELVAQLEGEPPAVLITQAEEDIYREFFASLQESNLTLDSYLASKNMNAEAFREDVKKQASSYAAQALALDAVARKLGFEVTDEEIKEEFASSGIEDPEALYEQWKSKGRLSEVREGILRMKASKYVIENAEVFETGKKPTAKKPAKKATKKPVEESAEAPAGEPAGEPAKDPVKEPVKKPAKKATKKEGV